MNFNSTKRDVLEHIIHDDEAEPVNLPLLLLQDITDDFSDKKKVGQGGFAIVYKGVLQNGNVAIKRILNAHNYDDDEFEAQVKFLMSIKHKNVVRFLGYCANTEKEAMKMNGKYIYVEVIEKLLCFEYIRNGSLENIITDELRGLEWRMRYDIIAGICNGLCYLHMEKKIIHMDLNPSNILLDDRMIPKITDFGLARIPEEETHTEHLHRQLTLGYSAPEYQFGGRMSFKSDIYCLGVIIMELVTGYKAIPDMKNVLRRWRHRWNKSGSHTPLLYLQVSKCIEIAVSCTKMEPNDRPSIEDIMQSLSEIGRTNENISNGNESTVEQISPYSRDLLGIEPLELYFPFLLNKKTTSSLQLTNGTDEYIAFRIQSSSSWYSIQPKQDVVPPQSKCSVSISRQSLAVGTKRKNELTVESISVEKGLLAEHITGDMFRSETGKLVDEVALAVVFDVQPEEKVTLEANFFPNGGATSSELVTPEIKMDSSNDLQSILWNHDSSTTALIPSANIDSSNDLQSLLWDQSSGPQIIPLHKLKEITNDFSDERILGQGGFGVVYKGLLPNGRMVAVKKIMSSLMPGLQKQFENEVSHLIMLKHPNIVRCLGYCYEIQKECLEYMGKHVFAEMAERLLVLEYLPNGSLEKYISDESSGLSWNTRYTIIKGICYGLCHLHKKFDKPILHLDLKPANILLDEEMEPKITDFGLSRLLDKEQSICTSTCDGTFGYMSPEFLHGGKITPKSDIFSLGVIILELITGHREYVDVTKTSPVDFTKHALERWSNTLKRTAGYRSLEMECKQIERCIEIGLRCVTPERTERPEITEVVNMIQDLDCSISSTTTLPVVEVVQVPTQH